MPHSLAVTADEESFLANGNLEAFWFSRLKKRDPVARIGYALWISNTDKLKAAIRSGDPAFCNRKGFAYWELLARSTVALGLGRPLTVWK